MFPFSPRRDLFPPFSNQPQGVTTSPQGSDLQPLDFNPTVQPQQQQPQTQPDDFASRMKSIYESANGPATKAYSDYLKSYPSDYKPSFATRLGASLSGMGAGWKRPGEGSLVAEQLLNAPRVQALQDWNSKAGALKAGADLEDKNFRDKIGVMKEIDTNNRNNKKDADEASLHQAQVNNYNSLVKERDKGKITYHEDKTSGHLFSINENGEKKDLGVMDLSPQQKEDLKIKTFNSEEGTRQKNRKDLFNFTSPLIEQRDKNVHKANREVDVNNPVRTASSSFESIDQQNKAITAAAKELNIENGGKYTHLFKPDGTLVDPDPGGFFKDDNTKELQDFYKLAQARAAQKLSQTRGQSKTQSTATTFPSVNLNHMGTDSRIEQ